MTQPRFGLLPPRYSVALYAYPDRGTARCPLCDGSTRRRKFPLLMHFDPVGLVALGKTCRFCPACDLIVVHQLELELELADKFPRVAPEQLGEHLLIGTVERSAWRRGMKTPLTLDEIRRYTSDFRRTFDIEVVFEPPLPRAIRRRSTRRS